MMAVIGVEKSGYKRVKNKKKADKTTRDYLVYNTHKTIKKPTKPAKRHPARSILVTKPEIC